MSPQFYVWHPQVACRTIDDTAFILLRSRMVSLNAVGTFVWSHFEKGTDASTCIIAVVEEFEVSEAVAQRDVDRFIEELLERSLLVSD